MKTCETIARWYLRGIIIPGFSRWCTDQTAMFILAQKGKTMAADETHSSDLFHVKQPTDNVRGGKLLGVFLRLAQREQALALRLFRTYGGSEIPSVERGWSPPTSHHSGTGHPNPRVLDRLRLFGLLCGRGLLRCNSLARGSEAWRDLDPNGVQNEAVSGCFGLVRIWI